MISKERMKRSCHNHNISSNSNFCPFEYKWSTERYRLRIHSENNHRGTDIAVARSYKITDEHTLSDSGIVGM